MKIAYVLSLSVFIGVTAVASVVSADKAAPALSTSADGTDEAQTKLIAKLNAQPTFSDSTLRRPF